MWPLLLAALTLSPPPTSRRQLLGRAAVAAAAAAAAAEVPVLAAHAEPSFFSTLQGPIQDVIAPGHWVGQLAGINSKTDRWDMKMHLWTRPVRTQSGGAQRDARGDIWVRCSYGALPAPAPSRKVATVALG